MAINFCRNQKFADMLPGFNLVLQGRIAIHRNYLLRQYIIYWILYYAYSTQDLASSMGYNYKSLNRIFKFTPSIIWIRVIKVLAKSKWESLHYFTAWLMRQILVGYMVYLSHQQGRAHPLNFFLSLFFFFKSHFTHLLLLGVWVGCLGLRCLEDGV